MTRYWERIFLAGSAKNLSTKDHSMGDRQPGTSYPVSTAYMTEFISGGVSSRLGAV